MIKKLILCLIGSGLLLSACVMPAPQPPMDGVETAISPTEEIVPTAPVDEEPKATATQTEEPEPTVSPTQEITPTLTPVNTPENENVETAEGDPEDDYRYEVQPGTPIGTINFVRPEAGCEWMGVGGQVFGLNSKPVNGLIVEVEGLLDSEPFLTLSMTGDEPILGPGGFVVKLSDQPIATQGTLWLQLFDLDGNSLSPEVPFDTFDGEQSCEKNLIVVNFSEIYVGLGYDYNLPLIFNGANSFSNQR